jgi:uncharacterized membrane protein YqhA
MMWQVIIHLTFVVSAFVMAWADQVASMPMPHPAGAQPH